MTPQAFSYATVSANGNIYAPPYGLTECIDYMIKINPETYQITKIPLNNTGKTERWTYGIEHDNILYFLPYNEESILCVDTINDNIHYIDILWPEKTNKVRGKYISFHLYQNKIYSLPYGETEFFDYIISVDTGDKTYSFTKIDVDINDCKKWHTSQIIDNIIYAVPRGERWTDNYFPYGIEFNCKDNTYKLNDLSLFWKDIDQQPMSNKKYTTLAKSNNNKLYAPPYSENPNFDIMLKFDKSWSAESTGIVSDSRKYFLLSFLIPRFISKGKIYYMPRGGCACEPVESWKQFGDLAEILVIDTLDDSYYTIDISEYFIDNTTIEKYNCCIIYNDIIYAFPYGESETFHTLLIFDTLLEQIVKTINLDEV